MTADPEYDYKKLYGYSKKTPENRDIVCPCRKIRKYIQNRLELVCFYQSVLGHTIYNQRRISASIEPSIEHIKSVFRIDPLPVYGFQSVSAIVLLSVLLYQIMVYYNCKIDKSKPPKPIKYMLGTW
jgi:hypothetical protein